MKYVEYAEIDRRIETLRNVADWNEEKAASCKNSDDKSRFVFNAISCREEIMDIIRSESLA